MKLDETNSATGFAGGGSGGERQQVQQQCVHIGGSTNSANVGGGRESSAIASSGVDDLSAEEIDAAVSAVKAAEASW